MDRLESVTTPKSRVWLVTLTTPWEVPSGDDATVDGDVAREGLRRMFGAWREWLAWLREKRTDVLLADAWAQCGHGGRWHVHAVLVTGETHASYRRGRPVLCHAEEARAAWLQATDGAAWSIDLQAIGRGRVEGKRGCRAAYYAARYAGRGWEDNAPPERVASVLSGCCRAHLCRRSRLRVARPKRLCPYCGDAHVRRMVWRPGVFVQVVPDGAMFRWGWGADGRWGPIEDVLPLATGTPTE